MDLSPLYALFPSLTPYAQAIGAAVVICAAIATRLPAPDDTAPSWWRMAYSAINFLALNVGHAKNADDVARAALAAVAGGVADGIANPRGQSQADTPIDRARGAGGL